MTTKQEAIDTILAMPDNVSLDDIAEEIRITAALQRSRKDIEAGRLIPSDEVMKVFDRWLGPSK